MDNRLTPSGDPQNSEIAESQEDPPVVLGTLPRVLRRLKNLLQPRSRLPRASAPSRHVLAPQLEYNFSGPEYLPPNEGHNPNSHSHRSVRIQTTQPPSFSVNPAPLSYNTGSSRDLYHQALRGYERTVNYNALATSASLSIQGVDPDTGDFPMLNSAPNTAGFNETVSSDDTTRQGYNQHNRGAQVEVGPTASGAQATRSINIFVDDIVTVISPPYIRANRSADREGLERPPLPPPPPPPPPPMADGIGLYEFRAPFSGSNALQLAPGTNIVGNRPITIFVEDIVIVLSPRGSRDQQSLGPHLAVQTLAPLPTPTPPTPAPYRQAASPSDEWPEDIIGHQANHSITPTVIGTTIDAPSTSFEGGEGRLSPVSFSPTSGRDLVNFPVFHSLPRAPFGQRPVFSQSGSSFNSFFPESSAGISP